MFSLEAVDLAQPEDTIIEHMMKQFTTVGFAYIKNI